ncbi:MAG: hypothetical protein NVS4B9_42620 [Ktedonobacteraceae bacterium]
MSPHPLAKVELIAAYAVLAMQMRREREWRNYALASVSVAVLSLLIFLVYQYGLPGASVGPWIGLIQRILFGVTLGWLEVLAVHLLALTARQETAEA